MSSMNDFIIEQLKEMGFEEKKIKRALQATKAESVEEVMEWIIQHEGDEEIEVETETAEGITDDVKVVQETTKEKTDEEKEQERKRYEDLIKQRRMEREEREKKEAVEKEKSRRKTGCEVSKLREKMENEERIRLAQEIRRDKLETQAHKQAILEQIKRDREAIKMRSAGNIQNTPVPPQPTVSSTTTTSIPSKDHTNCRLAIRLPNGETLQQEFSAKEQLASVRLYVQMNRPDKPFNESQLTSFDLIFPPNQRFTDEEMEKSLSELGLCPSARLTVSDRK